MTAVPKPKKRKPKRVTRDYADKLFSRYIRARDKVCQRCGTTESLQAAHIVSRRYASTRFDPDNCIALCRGCHLFFTQRPADWWAWIDERIGVQEHLNLRSRALTLGQKTDLKAVCGWLNQALREMEA